jgi:mRNA interferase MazF
VTIRIHRGEIWWADLDEPLGSEPGYSRPVVVLQTNYLNHSGLSTVVAVALTSNLRLAGLSGNVLLPKRRSGLTKDSVVNVTQLMAVDKDALREKAGSLDHETMGRVAEGVRMVLDL